MVCVVLILYADRLIFELIKVNENINYKYRGMIFYILETQSALSLSDFRFLITLEIMYLLIVFLPTADNMKTEEK